MLIAAHWVLNNTFEQAYFGIYGRLKVKEILERAGLLFTFYSFNYFHRSFPLRFSNISVASVFYTFIDLVGEPGNPGIETFSGKTAYRNDPAVRPYILEAKHACATLF